MNCAAAAADDRLEGGGGDDLLAGGAGNDLYVFDLDNALGSDRVEEEAGGGIDTVDLTPTTTESAHLDLGSLILQTVSRISPFASPRLRWKTSWAAAALTASSATTWKISWTVARAGIGSRAEEAMISWRAVPVTTVTFSTWTRVSGAIGSGRSWGLRAGGHAGFFADGLCGGAH